jgi:hypothetical protein
VAIVAQEKWSKHGDEHTFSVVGEFTSQITLPPGHRSSGIIKLARKRGENLRAGITCGQNLDPQGVTGYSDAKEQRTDATELMEVKAKSRGA